MAFLRRALCQQQQRQQQRKSRKSFPPRIDLRQKFLIAEKRKQEESMNSFYEREESLNNLCNAKGKYFFSLFSSYLLPYLDFAVLSSPKEGLIRTLWSQSLPPYVRSRSGSIRIRGLGSASIACRESPFNDWTFLSKGGRFSVYNLARPALACGRQMVSISLANFGTREKISELYLSLEQIFRGRK